MREWEEGKNRRELDEGKE
jgi:hypothetical protein